MFPIFSPTKILDSLILMQIVTEGPLHGYALASSIEEKFGWKPSQTAVYNSLKSMENENIIVAEERIEKGRAQKIYSLTDYGKQFIDETQCMMKEHMKENFSQFFSFVQMIGEIENIEESKAIQESIHHIFENMKRISQLTMLLVKDASKEAQAVIEDTFISLKKIAEKYNVPFKTEEK